MELENISIHRFIEKNGIKNENGTPIDFYDHFFQFDPYSDLSPKQVTMKAAQIGATNKDIIKSLWVAKNLGINIIYTLPTDSDRNLFAGGKVNKIIAQNPIFQEWTKDKDSVEQKQVGESTIYYKGTWTQKAAIMVSSDLNIYDEVDASKQDVIDQYSTRLQHSKLKWEWFFSHPSSEGTGVHKYWQKSDQKHWFVKCKTCGKENFMEWPHSFDMEAQVYICKECKAPLTDDDRRFGRWVARYKKREFSGYWIPLFICPWVTAAEIIKYNNEKSEEYFFNKVLGLPYVGGGNKLTRALLFQNLTEELITPDTNERIVIGVDTGKKLHYVVGGEKGLFFYDEAKDYDEIEHLLDRWKRAIAVIDQGGDLIGSRKLRSKYPGRVYLCMFGADRKTKNLVKWGAKDENGAVTTDRNRTIQMVVDEFSDKRIALQGNENDWHEYFLHWNNLSRIKEIDDKTGEIKRKIWVRSGDDHFALATVYWRVGMSRFSGTGHIIKNDAYKFMETPSVNADDTIAVDLKKMIKFKKPKKDWRKR
jgi:hypothetical protein